MLHAYFVYDPICFMYLFIQYLAFLGTNLLTRCHSASSCFLLFLYFRKSCTGNILRITRDKLSVPYNHVMKNVPEDDLRGASQVARPHPGAARAWPAPGWRLGPPGRPRLRLFAYLFSVSGKPWRHEKKSMKSSVAAVIAEARFGGQKS